MGDVVYSSGYIGALERSEVDSFGEEEQKLVFSGIGFAAMFESL